MADRDRIDKALKNAPDIELVDAEGWQKCRENNTDPYGSRIVLFAEDWARLMQLNIAEGAKLEECATYAAAVADYDGITGFMYGAAVNILAHVWKHGEELRRWHNIETQIGNEGERANESGGVLNPAILNVSR